MSAMKEYFCPSCNAVFYGGGGKCCGSPAVPFDPDTHGHRLIGASNSWHFLWNEWKDHPVVEQVASEWAEDGHYGAARILNEAFKRLEAAGKDRGVSQ